MILGLFFLHYMLDSVISRPVFLPLGHAVTQLWSVPWIQAPCFGWASGKHQPSRGFQKGLSHLSTWAWRNRSTDKTPNPKLINIKAATPLSSLCSLPSLFSHPFPRKPSFTQLFPRPFPDLVSLFLSTDYQRPWQFYPPHPLSLCSSLFCSQCVGCCSTGGRPQVTERSSPAMLMRRKRRRKRKK